MQFIVVFVAISPTFPPLSTTHKSFIKEMNTLDS